ncbi:hypothetical protein E4U60_003092 [Claviceps pazoutovae]|uniref:Uncharacterized protein n=1 Tax=Claviceps pazoutovae TaxID=1649127 RepID=A0A9P7MAI3_9HYPO|nr:hypothetical protein E4U60_003092 [Claviceps pazoutovae]
MESEANMALSAKMAERDARISMSAGPFNPRDNPSDRLLCTCTRASLRSPFLPYESGTEDERKDLDGEGGRGSWMLSPSELDVREPIPASGRLKDRIARQNSKLWLLARSKAFRMREARWFEGEVVLLMVSSIICVGENKTSLVAHGETGEFLQEQWHPGPSSSNVQVSGPGWRLAH